MTRALVGVFGLGLALAACDDALPTTGDDDPACSEGCACHTDDDCADPHAVCLVAAHGSACDCAAGYARIDGFTCDWTGVVGDPQFVAGAWSTTPGFVIDPDASGTLIDPGGAVYTMAACFGLPEYPTASQALVMPRFSRAEPLQINVRVEGSNAALAYTDVHYGGAMTTHQPQPLIDNFGSVCLGPAAYAPESSTGQGAPVPFAVQLEAYCTSTVGSPKVTLDHVDIGPPGPGDPACPAPNVVLGHVDDDDGWTYQYDPATDVVGFVPGIGEDHTPGLELGTHSLGEPSARTLVSVPVGGAAGNPSLRLYRRVDTPLAAMLAVSETPDGQLPTWFLPVAPDVEAVEHYCLPAGSFGTVIPFTAQYNVFQDDNPSQLVIDSVSVQPDPACGTDPLVADGGFESGYPVLSTDETRLLPTPDLLAHGGAADLQRSITGCDSSFSAFEVVTPDLPTPALRFWYRVSAPNFFLSSPPTSNGELVGDNQWHDLTVCLTSPPGTPAVEYFEVFSSIGDCTTPATFSLDDLELTSDPACGSQE